MFSFVMPAYKSKFLKEAIDSILQQSCPNLELVIVNDASPEDLDTIVSSYKDPRISYYKNAENIGGKDLVKQWNHCITYAKGEYIVLASDDDIYHKDYLKDMSSLASEYPEVGVLRPLINQIDETGKIFLKEKELPVLMSSLTFLAYHSKEEMLAGIPQYAFKSEALLDGGFVNFPLAWFSDDATVAKIAHEHGGIAICNKHLFSFRLWSQSISGRKNNYETFKKKSLSSTLFYKFITENIHPSDEVLNDAKIRIRASVLWDLDRCSIIESFKRLYYLWRINSEVFFLSWVCKKFLGTIRRRLMNGKTRLD